MTNTKSISTAKGAIPFVFSPVHAGFPSPADDYAENVLDLGSLVIHHPEATFYVRVTGDSMKGAGIADGDILVVDRALPAAHGSIIIAMVSGEFTVKHLYVKEGTMLLLPANSLYKPISISEDTDFQVWGVVTYSIRKVR
jgi:DNA polymerase V